MLTARMFSSFLKFNSRVTLNLGGKDHYFNGLGDVDGEKQAAQIRVEP